MDSLGHLILIILSEVEMIIYTFLFRPFDNPEKVIKIYFYLILKF